ncbi:hypothetical protein QQX98_001383 [Neonectria punicea]|uniref:Protein kinase domain-containing protein n=1 Tax=Neonectria punicea TaxID=979145 RepID=A0ABR1HQK5_9HYPO
MPSSRTDTDFVSYRKVLTILIFIEKQDQIRSFIDNQLHDGLLPLQKIGDSSNDCQLVLPNSNVLHPCFQGWENVHVSSFENYQRKLNAPYFKFEDDICRHYCFPENVALPFIHQDPCIEGGFAHVMKVALPREHGNLETCDQQEGKEKQLLAIKRLCRRSRGPFEAESNVLYRLNSISKHREADHVVKLLATFEIDSQIDPELYFIFPCADCDLRQFWKEIRKPPDEAYRWRLSKWVARQMRGLSHGLLVLHQFARFRVDSDLDPRNRGIHGDIKPENILVFKKWNGVEDGPGILQLADFGLARYHRPESVNRVAPRRVPHCYVSPESGLGRETGQASDVWAMGCLFLEFSVWLLFGYDGLESFTQDRGKQVLEKAHTRVSAFYRSRSVRDHSVESDKISINKGVLKWVAKLHSAAWCPQFIHDVVDIAVLEMLALNHEPQDEAGTLPDLGETTRTRPSSERNKYPHRIVVSDLVERLDGMLERGLSYFQDASPYDSSSFTPPALTLPSVNSENATDSHTEG